MPFRARKKRKLESVKTESVMTESDIDVNLPQTQTEAEAITNQPPADITSTTSTQCDPVLTRTISTQTEETIYSKLDVQEKVKKLQREIEDQKAERVVQNEFYPEHVNGSKIKNLFKYYTGLPYATFLVLFTFLFPNGENCVQYSEKRKDIRQISTEDQLFLVLCMLRNGFHLKDLAFRFSISVQSASVIFNSLIHFMYLKFGYLSYWPHRDVIIENMTPDYRKEFPTSIAIIDCTELKTQTPSAFDCQSQCYSEYKSNTTLKSLVAVDPRGSVMFVSLLFSGSISDNEICIDSGFYNHLRKLKEQGYIHDRDAIMADKGFRIASKLSELNINLNSPPFASCTSQMSVGDVTETKRIAAHRIHVERSINRIKNFKLVNRRVPVSLFHMINEIWFVCAILTNFLPTLVKK